MDVGASRLGPEQALEIAKEIQKGERKEFPKWLNRTEKEMVEASLDFLLATDKALKTWWVKSNYLEKREQAVSLKRKLSQTMLSSIESLGTLNEIKRRQSRLKFDLRSELTSLVEDYADRISLAERWMPPRDFKRMTPIEKRRAWETSPGQRLVKNVLIGKSWEAAKEINQWQGNKVSDWSKALMGGLQKESVRKAQRIVSSLSKSGQAISNEFIAKCDELDKMLPGMQIDLAEAVVGDPWKEQFQRLSTKTVPKLNEAYEEASRKADEWKAQCKFAGTFYIIAALGEFMENLARSIG